jgi:hypothetical protein
MPPFFNFAIVLISAAYAAYQKFNDADVSILVWVALVYFLFRLIKGCAPQNIITHEEAKELLLNEKLPKV